LPARRGAGRAIAQARGLHSIIAMLVQLGQRNAKDDLVELLIECHGRMRKYLVLAHRLAESSGAGDAEIREVANQIRRYFAESFPLHVADEDEALAPRLAGKNESVDQALGKMSADHAAHEPAIQRLVGLCTRIAGDPRSLAATAPDLAGAAGWLATELESHLELEEREIFPLVRLLPADQQAAIRAALRDRRERPVRDARE
jgi:iron-sulfur cluster repair protein YtfE (RIC family)